MSNRLIKEMQSRNDGRNNTHHGCKNLHSKEGVRSQENASKSQASKQEKMIYSQKTNLKPQIEPEKFQGLRLIWVMGKRNFCEGVQKEDEELIHRLMKNQQRIPFQSQNLCASPRKVPLLHQKLKKQLNKKKANSIFLKRC